MKVFFQTNKSFFFQIKWGRTVKALINYHFPADIHPESKS